MSNYAQIYVDKQLQDNLRILDCMIRTMSTAEYLCNIKYSDKKYKIDKKNIYLFKNHEQIKDDFLLNTMLEFNDSYIQKKK